MKRLLSYLILISIATASTLNGSSQQKSGSENEYNPELRLKELGITLPSPSSPVANYVNGVRTGNLIFLAGKGPKRAVLPPLLSANLACSWSLADTMGLVRTDQST